MTSSRSITASAAEFLPFALLAGGQFVVENDHVAFQRLGLRDDFLRLARADEIGRLRAVDLRQHAVGDGQPERVDQFGQFGRAGCGLPRPSAASTMRRPAGRAWRSSVSRRRRTCGALTYGESAGDATGVSDASAVMTIWSSLTITVRSRANSRRPRDSCRGLLRKLSLNPWLKLLEKFGWPMIHANQAGRRAAVERFDPPDHKGEIAVGKRGVEDDAPLK